MVAEGVLEDMDYIAEQHELMGYGEGEVLLILEDALDLVNTLYDYFDGMTSACLRAADAIDAVIAEYEKVTNV